MRVCMCVCVQASVRAQRYMQAGTCTLVAHGCEKRSISRARRCSLFISPFGSKPAAAKRAARQRLQCGAKAWTSLVWLDVHGRDSVSRGCSWDEGRR